MPAAAQGVFFGLSINTLRTHQVRMLLHPEQRQESDDEHNGHK